MICLQFFDNHGLLSENNHHQWFHLSDGRSSYIKHLFNHDKFRKKEIKVLKNHRVDYVEPMQNKQEGLKVCLQIENIEKKENGATYATYDAGYPLRKNGHVELVVGGKVFRLYPDPEASGNLTEFAWHVEEDDEKIIQALKAGSKVTIEAISKRGTKTKDTFSLIGLTSAINETRKICN